MMDKFNATEREPLLVLKRFGTPLGSILATIAWVVAEITEARDKQEG